jgi:hypothetical protein
MVPLLILLWKPLNVPDETILEPCRCTVPTILRLLERMKSWSLTASRSCALIGRIFEAALQDVAVAHAWDFDLTGRGDDPSSTQNGNPEDLLIQQSLEFDLGLDLAFLGYEQDTAMVASLDSYSIVNPLWEGSFS